MGQVIAIPNTGSNTDIQRLYKQICIDLQGECLKDLADRAMCSDSTLRNWRDGRTISPRVITLMNVAEALNYKITWRRA